LTITRRCGRRIIEWASHVIAGDPGRPHDRPALACAAGSPDGEVALLGFRSEVVEANGIAALIRQLTERDVVPAEEILVLLRGDHNGTFSRPIKAALDELRIAYSDPDAVERMLAEPNNRRMLATFRLLAHDRDSLAWASLLLLAPGIGQTFCDYIYERARVARAKFGEALFTAWEIGWLRKCVPFPESARIAPPQSVAISRRMIRARSIATSCSSLDERSQQAAAGPNRREAIGAARRCYPRS
jgi:superfamily I DNA/RNA helicase